MVGAIIDRPAGRRIAFALDYGEREGRAARAVNDRPYTFIMGQREHCLPEGEIFISVS